VVLTVERTVIDDRPISASVKTFVIGIGWQKGNVCGVFFAAKTAATSAAAIGSPFAIRPFRILVIVDGLSWIFPEATACLRTSGLEVMSAIENLRLRRVNLRHSEDFLYLLRRLILGSSEVMLGNLFTSLDGLAEHVDCGRIFGIYVHVSGDLAREQL
jgi:hypothetical protein